MKKNFLIFVFLFFVTSLFSQQIEADLYSFLGSHDSIKFEVLTFKKSVKTQRVLKIMRNLEVRPATAAELLKYYEGSGSSPVVSPRAYYIKKFWIGNIKVVPVIYKGNYYLDSFRGKKWPTGTKFVGIKE